MKLKIKDFIIQEDRNGFILEEYGDKKQEDGTFIYGLKETTFPATLEKALEKALHRYKGHKTEVLEFENWINEVKKINKDFLNELKSIIK